MAQIYLGLGANVGDKEANIRKALTLLAEHISNIEIASFYFTKPVGFTNQDNFLNTVVKGFTKLSPKKLLQFIKTIEAKIGRIRRFKNGPREIDIDILFYDDLIYKDKKLEIPHPRLSERDFVLQPLFDIDPDFIHPFLKKKVKELLYVIPKNSRSIYNIFKK